MGAIKKAARDAKKASRKPRIHVHTPDRGNVVSAVSVASSASISLLPLSFNFIRMHIRQCFVIRFVC